MPQFGPIKRSDLVHYLRQAGFDGPYAGGKHSYMVKGQLKLVVPNPHHGEAIGRDLLTRVLRQAGIDKAEWERL
jgi:predicted RNA binding protein YcfA (HicA-like mRNA interferase family)